MNHLLVLSAGLCMTLSLAEAWALSAIRHMKVGFFVRRVASPRYLVKSHVDYILMALLQLALFGMSHVLGVALPAWLVVCVVLGSLGNPAGFLALALRPDLPQAPTGPFGRVMALSFVATTIGYLGASAIFVAHALAT